MSAQPGVMGRIFHCCVPACAIPICLLTYLFQMAIYNVFLIKYSYNFQEAYPSDNLTQSTAYGFNPWYFTVIPDLVVFALFITAFVKCHQHSNDDSNLPETKKPGGELPFGYIAWGSYAILNIFKVAVIFRWIAPALTTEGLLGTNMVKIAVSLSCVVWISLVLNHNNAEPGSSRDSFITFLAHSVTMDVLDTTEILQVIMQRESGVTLTYELHKAVIAIACINLFLPTILLIALNKSRFGRDDVWMKRTQALHKILHVCLVNLPLLVLRVILWHVHSTTISVFIIKNALALGIMVRTIHLQISSAVIAAANRTDAIDADLEMVAFHPASMSPPNADEIEETGSLKSQGMI